jgi:chemotaxis signal transduction protein
MELCLFRIDQQEYAVPMTAVREVLNRPRLSPVPLAPDTLSGMTHFRGDVVPVFAVDKLFAPLDKKLGKEDRSRVLVLTQASQILGILVDQVDEMVLLQDEKALFPAESNRLLQEPTLEQNKNFKAVSLPYLFHSLQQTLSQITLKLIN